ncbi:MAG: exodeoxyribonuclease VII small subunit [Chloroflexi bacterium]|nr:exodeoxyribonuclease VII small subunit [Chloroflexota bacterium]
MPKSSSKAPSFETAFHELDSTVEKLERGDLSLEESIALYERGIKLAAQLEKQLEEAELRVRKLQPEPGEAGDADAFADDAEDDES